jgi:hypothetical protein
VFMGHSLGAPDAAQRHQRETDCIAARSRARASTRLGRTAPTDQEPSVDAGLMDVRGSTDQLNTSALEERRLAEHETSTS